MGIATALLTLWLALNWDWPQWHLYSWTVSIASGFLNLAALMFLYKALARGPVSLASPAASTFSVILVVMNAIAGEPYTWQQGVAVLLVFGVVMLACASGGGKMLENYSASWLQFTALLGLGTGVTVALRFYYAQEALTILGPWHSLYLNRVAAFFSIALLLVWQNSGRLHS